jgi:hypothetical protein
MSSNAQLIPLAENFCRAFTAALVKSNEDFAAVLGGRGKGFSSGSHGTVEFTDELIEASRKLSVEAIKVHGAGKIHQKSVEEIARNIAFEKNDSGTMKTTARAIVDGIAEAARTAYRIIRPNSIFHFSDGIEEIKIGPVRIVTRESVRLELETQFSGLRITAVGPANEPFTYLSGFESGEEIKRAEIHLPELCWDVSLQGMPRGHELQALWFIDVAVSFVRLQYDVPLGLFPGYADVEPHPMLPPQFYTHGLTIGPNGPVYGGGTAPTWYQIDADFAERLMSPEVMGAANLIFTPQTNTLAERMQQALGWLTRARRAHEPAERVLLFFTALEALLSGESKGGAVTDTIARYVGVIWSSEPKTRAALSRTLKNLYDLRSAIVHNGERSVAQLEANNIHYIAWTITRILLRRADLTVPYKDFVATLREATFGAKLEM